MDQDFCYLAVRQWNTAKILLLFQPRFLIERFRGGVEPNGCIFAANNSNNSGGARISRWTPPQVVALN
jgi:hypothetical protein